MSVDEKKLIEIGEKMLMNTPEDENDLLEIVKKGVDNLLE